MRRLIVANRTLENAQALAGRFGAYAIALADLPQHLAEADIVITLDREPRAGAEHARMVEDAIRARRRKPMFLVDIAVPRDIAADVAEARRRVPVHHRRSATGHRRQPALAPGRGERGRSDHRPAGRALSRLAPRARRAAIRCRVCAATPRISATRLLEKARQLLAGGRTPEQALEFLAHTLTNKLLHAPSANLRAAALRGDVELLRAAEQLVRRGRAADTSRDSGRE